MKIRRRALSGATAALIAMAGVALVASSVAATPSPSVALLGSVGRSDGGSLTTANGIVVCSAPGLPEWSGNSESPTCSDGEAVVRTSGVSAADTFRIENLGADSYRVALFYEDDPGGIVTSGVAAVTLASGNVATCTLIAGSSPTATCVAMGAATVTGTVTDADGGALFPAGMLICDGPLKAQLNQLNDL